MEEFRRVMGTRLPEFLVRHTDKTHREVIFEKSIRSDLSFFVRIYTYDRHEEFDVEIAWTESPDPEKEPAFPRHILGMLPSEAPDSGSKRFTLHWLKPDPAPGAVGWNFAPDPDVFAAVEDWLEPKPPVEELLRKVPELVEEAIAALLELGMPYFDRVSRDLSSERTQSPPLP